MPSTGVLATEISTTILTGFLIPFDEVKDVTCTEAFRKMAHWHPDAVAWFDYTTTPPTLYFRSPGDGGLATATLTKGVPPLVSIGQITPRPELQAPAVVIHYEVTTTNNGAASSSISTDVAFVSANGILTGAGGAGGLRRPRQTVLRGGADDPRCAASPPRRCSSGSTRWPSRTRSA